jgi:hypothetical protein
VTDQLGKRAPGTDPDQLPAVLGTVSIEDPRASAKRSAPRRSPVALFRAPSPSSRSASVVPSRPVPPPALLFPLPASGRPVPSCLPWCPKRGRALEVSNLRLQPCETGSGTRSRRHQKTCDALSWDDVGNRRSLTMALSAICRAESGWITPSSCGRSCAAVDVHQFCPHRVEPGVSGKFETVPGETYRFRRGAPPGTSTKTVRH